MELTREMADDLLARTQDAHLLAVGFYQRLLGNLKRISQELDLEFWHWQPRHNSGPGRGSTPPDTKWAWDFVPLFASRHVYGRAFGDTARSGDATVQFNIYLNEGYKSAARTSQRRGGPDPLSLGQGACVVEIMIYRCTGESPQSFQRLWNKSKEPNEQDVWQNVGELVNAKFLKFALADLMLGEKDIVAKVKNALAENTETAGAESSIHSFTILSQKT